jgi:hypothetical protein
MCGGYSRIAAMKRVLLVDDEPELTEVVRGSTCSTPTTS